MFSSTQQALQIMKHLKKHYRGPPQKLLSIAAELHLPPHFVKLKLQALSKHRLVITSRGSKGGAALARAPESILLEEIICAITGPPLNCATPITDGLCNPAIDCPITDVLKERAKYLRNLRSSRNLKIYSEIAQNVTSK